MVAGGDAQGGGPAHQVGGVFNVEEVDLAVLAGGDVEDFFRLLFGHVGEDFHLLRVEAAEGRVTGLEFNEFALSRNR